VSDSLKALNELTRKISIAEIARRWEPISLEDFSLLLTGCSRCGAIACRSEILCNRGICDGCQIQEQTWRKVKGEE